MLPNSREVLAGNIGCALACQTYLHLSKNSEHLTHDGSIGYKHKPLCQTGRHQAQPQLANADEEAHLCCQCLKDCMHT